MAEAELKGTSKTLKEEIVIDIIVALDQAIDNLDQIQRTVVQIEKTSDLRILNIIKDQALVFEGETKALGDFVDQEVLSAEVENMKVD